MGTGGITLAAFVGFLPPVSHMMMTMTKAMLMSSQDCTFLGNKPGGFGAFS